MLPNIDTSCPKKLIKITSVCSQRRPTRINIHNNMHSSAVLLSALCLNSTVITRSGDGEIKDDALINVENCDVILLQ